ncbi:hypothetical protein PR202_gb12690 [Eleusine coracana subsp. coracana]|uniref:Uncharacterized protein n=1 Tax=Eleusine coracana subsp. coracana TaxID=191504 RepID=A0AAV5ENH7_ELECO|nr:hypothetical protein PR202_gb12690 [Eleusine coracana subsp. coracana]
MEIFKATHMKHGQWSNETSESIYVSAIDVWVLIRRPSSVPESLWTLITSCVRPSQNLVYCNAPSTRRCCLPPNNSWALLVPGGQYKASLPTGRRIEWNEFKPTFRAHFIPVGLM